MFFRGTRPSFRRLAKLCLALGTAGAIALFIISTTGATGEDDYGRLSVPGKGTLDLPAGDVALFYEERVTLQNDDSLDVPDGLRVVARREVTVRSENTVTNAINLDGRSLREFAKLAIPAAGRYRIRVRVNGPVGNTPAVTFGQGLGKTMADAGVKAAAAFGGGLALALLLLLLGRVGYTAGPAVRYVQSAPAAPPPAPRPPQPDGDAAGRLAELDRMREAGLISDEEHAAGRARVLDSM